MANRKKRKELYQASVKGKIGGLDVVTVDDTAPFIINAKGAKVYRDVSKHSYLNIPELISTEEKGSIYEVLSIGAMGTTAIITVKIGDLPLVYRLPDWYLEWARTITAASMSGSKLLPSNIEFGFYPKEKRY